MRRFFKKFFRGSSAPRFAHKRPTVRPQLEQLDERLLPSQTGAISSVVAQYGPNSYQRGDVTYSIGQDKNLYESVNGMYSQRVDNGNCDLQVSAGVDQYGHSVAYVLNTYGSLWGLITSWDSNHAPYQAPYVWAYVHIADNVNYDPHNWWSSFSAAMGKDYWTGATGGVYFISNRNDFFWNFGTGSMLISNAGVDYQITAGTDWGGYNLNYVLNGVNHDVYKRYGNGAWYMVDLSYWGENGNIMEIAGSIDNILYMLVDPYGGPYAPYWEDAGDIYGTGGAGVTMGIAMMWDGFNLTEVSYWWGYDNPGNQQVMQISAGTDASGHSTLDYIVVTNAWWDDNNNLSRPISGDLYQFDTGNGYTYYLASNIREVCAGQGGYDYWKDIYENLFRHDPWGDFWQMGDHLDPWGDAGWQ